MSTKEMLKLVDLKLIKEPEKPVREKMTEEGLEELAKSLSKVGLINPITLVKSGSGYEIDKGHRRFLAARSLGWEKIKAIVREYDGENLAIGRIHENLHKEDMSPIEEAKSVKELLDSSLYSERDVSKLCSKSESWVRSRLALLEMPGYLQEAVDVGAISVSAAKELNGITDEQAQRFYVDYAIKSGATAVLCAFWRNKWLVERIVNDPSAIGDGSFALAPPPMEVRLPCFWCEQEIPIRLINHLRVCPKCTESIARAKQLIQQEQVEARDASINSMS